LTHAYTVGDCTQAIIYAVDRLRDGRSYATRTVKALQRGKCIFTMTASFQVPEPGQPIRYLALPRPPSGEAAFPEPDRCQPTEERIAAFLAENAAVIPTKVRVFLETLQDERRQSRIEIRSALPDDFGDFWRGNQTSDQQAFWIRSRPGDELRSDDAFRRCVLAFISDYHLIGTSSKALGLNTRGGRRLAMMASLDHSLHFYEPIDPQNWMLYHVRDRPSPVLGQSSRPDR
jgi:acyl-CoA thioesterase 8